VFVTRAAAALGLLPRGLYFNRFLIGVQTPGRYTLTTPVAGRLVKRHVNLVLGETKRVDLIIRLK
jgi:hypothetical protein